MHNLVKEMMASGLVRGPKTKRTEQYIDGAAANDGVKQDSLGTETTTTANVATTVQPIGMVRDGVSGVGYTEEQNQGVELIINGYNMLSDGLEKLLGQKLSERICSDCTANDQNLPNTAGAPSAENG